MARNPDTAEQLLQTVITAFETEDDARIAKAMRLLLTTGPLEIQKSITQQDETANDGDDVLSARAEILQFLRHLVRVANIDKVSYNGIAVDGQVIFAGRLSGGRASHVVTAGSWRDLAVLQLLFLLDRVGLRNVRECAAPDCQRIFVKTYRREYCSTQCQERHNKQQQRRNRRNNTARRRERRLRKGVS